MLSVNGATILDRVIAVSNYVIVPTGPGTVHRRVGFVGPTSLGKIGDDPVVDDEGCHSCLKEDRYMETVSDVHPNRVR